MSSRPLATEEELSKTPMEIRRLMSPDSEYRLTKMESNGRPSGVYVGEGVRGELKIVGVQGQPAVLVMRSWSSYIRTSPIVRVLDSDSTSVTFQTEGGIYKLEVIGE